LPFRSLLLIAAACSLLLSSQSKGDSGTLSPLHAFTGADGSLNILQGTAETYLPPVSLAAGKKGVLFGTTPMGGATNRGTVFSLTPAAAQGQPWSHAILHNFSGSTDGSGPTGGVAVGADGTLYGFNNDTVYRVVPPSKSGGAWLESVIYRFSLIGDNPGSGVQGTPLLIGNSIYGVTTSCGFGSTVTTCGAVFRLAPPSSANGPWKLSTIWSFRYPANAAALAPTGFLIAGPKGKLYGTLFGGFEVKAGIFELTPPSSAGKPWVYNTIYSFPTKKPDGSQLAGPIAIGRFGEIYGTTENGGASGLGEIFKLSPPASAGGRWTKTASDAPFAALGAPAAGGAVLASNGGLYSFVQSGAVIQITPTSGGAWPSKIVHQFQGGKDGATPLTLVAFPGSPTLYGLTENAGSAGADPAGAGGSFGWGTVFQLKP
jgi:uncharacterized repeat protein (TIGR03803 family)